MTCEALVRNRLIELVSFKPRLVQCKPSPGPGSLDDLSLYTMSGDTPDLARLSVLSTVSAVHLVLDRGKFLSQGWFILKASVTSFAGHICTKHSFCSLVDLDGLDHEEAVRIGPSMRELCS